ncbi:RNA polymerase ECF-type sigma factor [Formosa agariphila KMM 3901]|uniref:RNA polymerase ECF-type sigma factor n=1 Tax=Formosa agariphila (strain DSM 15362 / KCTC 12365 / LMG 23005 / KMM 3901 / M-2Alg 35-1) TaxID=1347342 RepID=T2KPM3_FORAG|nr:RNA polymerase sigma factor [Formosa agariphila]CDF80443.1 RNA polymerase ECF-type sigma factor [Formosa agariphila KMM 3901]
MCKDLKDKYVELIQQNEGIIYKVINLHIDNTEDKKDLFQEILLQAWKSFPKFEERSSFTTWLYRVSLNTVFTFRKTTNKKVETSVESLPDIKSIELNEKPHELLYLLIKQLDKVDRTIMTLHLDSYKNKEIAEILGINVNHINVKIHRLKNQIIESYKKSTHG